MPIGFFVVGTKNEIIVTHWEIQVFQENCVI